MPQIVLIGGVGKIADMVWIWEVFGAVISFRTIEAVSNTHLEGAMGVNLRLTISSEVGQYKRWRPH
jgi:hypothetical protein